MNEPLPGEEDSKPLSNGCFKFAGQILQKFSFDRQAAWQRMNAVASSESDLLIIFLCLTPIEEVRTIRYDDEKTAFLAKMAEWCESLGITIDKENEGRKAANVIANQIASDMKKVRFRPKLESSGGELGNAQS